VSYTRREHFTVRVLRPGSNAPAGVGFVELPLAPRDFSGRAEEIQRLTEWLTADHHGPRLVNIYGMPGSGKTALALRVAQDVGAEYPDCQLHFNLRSSDQSPVSIDTLLGRKLVTREVEFAAAGEGPGLRQAIRSWIGAAGSGPGFGIS
jgi:hypothetical protein